MIKPINLKITENAEIKFIIKVIIIVD